MALRDNRSYETQIIDAVRSVNRALGGTYGTSSAIYKSEFNQYEVQLIDAIKGIGRTLSGSGLSGLAGGAGDLTGIESQLQDLSKRVTTLESESFFRLVDGNVTLKPGYSNLWVPGFLAAGGVGSGGGGGVSYLKELQDVYHDLSGVLRADGTAVVAGDALVYNATLGWVAASVGGGGGGGGSTVSLSNRVTNGGRIVTITIDGTSYDIKNSVEWTSAGTTPNTFGLKISGTTKTVCLDGYTSGVVTGYIGTTLVQSLSQPQALTGISSVKLTSSSSLFEWDNDHSAWHFHGNVYADGWVAAGGIGTGGGDYTAGDGISISSRVISLKVASANSLGGIKVGSGLSISNDGTLSVTGGGGGGGISTIQLKTGSTNGTLKLSVNGYDGADVAVYGLGSLAYKSSLSASDIPDISGTYVTLANSQTITGSKTFTADQNMKGGSLVFLNSSSTKVAMVNATTGYIKFRTGTNIGTSYKDITFHETYGFYPEQSGTNLGYNGANYRWATIYGVNSDLTGNLSMARTSTIAIGPVTISYDSTNKALHVSGTDNGTPIGLYCDSWVAAGGVQAS